MFQSCAVTTDDQFLLAGTYLGDVKMFNIASGVLEATYSCHESHVNNLQVSLLHKQVIL